MEYLLVTDIKVLLPRLRLKVRPFSSSSRETHGFGDADIADAKSAKPWRIGGGSGWSSFVKACHDRGVAFAVICNEFSSDVTGHRTDHRGPTGTFEVKAGATAEFQDPENG
jgi:hypothetical protein